MRAQSLTLAAVGIALLAPTTSSVAARQVPGALGAPAPRQEGAVRAADLLARVRDCVPVSRGRYRTDDGTPATVPVCGTREAVFWKADMDIDCDGRPGRYCNSTSDALFSGATAFTQSDGRYLSAETLPYIVVPGASGIWNYRDHGVRGGSVAAVVYRDRVQYAVVGDVGPSGIIGEASYATAKALGIRPDPHGGGTSSGVTYIVFKDSRATPIESHASAVAVGERLARLFVRQSAQPARRPDTGPDGTAPDGTAPDGAAPDGAAPDGERPVTPGEEPGEGVTAPGAERDGEAVEPERGRAEARPDEDTATGPEEEAEPDVEAEAEPGAEAETEADVEEEAAAEGGE